MHIATNKVHLYVLQNCIAQIAGITNNEDTINEPIVFAAIEIQSATKRAKEKLSEA